MALYTRFINSSAVTSRAAEFSDTYSDATDDGPWYATCNNGASNSPGIGIGTQTNLQAAPSAAWTLKDQADVARTFAAGNQKAQVLGGAGYTAPPTAATMYSSQGVEGSASQSTQLIATVTNPDNVSGVPDPAYPAPTITGTAQLASLAAGWVALP